LPMQLGAVSVMTSLPSLSEDDSSDDDGSNQGKKPTVLSTTSLHIELREAMFGSNEDIPVWRGAIVAERTARVITALRRSRPALLVSCFACLALGCGIKAVTFDIEGLGKIAWAFLAAALSLPLAVHLLSPIVIQLGFGPSRVRWRALLEFSRLVCPTLAPARKQH